VSLVVFLNGHDERYKWNGDQYIQVNEEQRGSNTRFTSIDSSTMFQSPYSIATFCPFPQVQEPKNVPKQILLGSPLAEANEMDYLERRSCLSQVMTITWGMFSSFVMSHKFFSPNHCNQLHSNIVLVVASVFTITSLAFIPRQRLLVSAFVHRVVQHFGANLPQLGCLERSHCPFQDLLRAGAMTCDQIWKLQRAQRAQPSSLSQIVTSHMAQGPSFDAKKRILINT